MRGGLASAKGLGPEARPAAFASRSGLLQSRGPGGRAMADQRMEHAPWPMRAGILLALGALCGLAFDLLISGDTGSVWSVTDSMMRLSLASFVAISGVLFAFTLERTRWTWSL